MKKESEKQIGAQAEQPAPRRIALFGGSFDPVTVAHAKIVRNLSKKFDKVIVLPCFLSPFKPDANITLANDRVKMLKKAFAQYENVKVSRWEIKREMCSYSYLAVNHFSEKYPGDKLYFVVGSDGLDRLPEWKNVRRIAEKATFLLVKRPDFPVSASLLQKLAEQGYPVEVARFTGGEGSSSEVRVANAFGRLESVVPLSVAEYIRKHGLYEEYVYITESYADFHLKSERIEHTYRTAKTGISLAKTFGVNVQSVLTAVLLHDIGKYADKKTLDTLGVTVPEEVYSLPEAIRHAPVSAAIAEQYFMITDTDILAAIATHTTGAPNMTVLQKVVYLADAVEEGREFPGCKAVRRKAFADLNKGMLAMLKNTVDYVSQSGSVYPKTIEAYDFYRQPVLRPGKTKRAEKPISGEDGRTAEKPISGEDGRTAEKAADAVKTVKAKRTAKNTAASPEPSEEPAKPAPLQKTTAKTEEGDAIGLADPSGSPLALAEKIGALLSEKKARDVVLIDLAGKTIISDYFVIAGAGSTTAVKALCEYVDEKLSKEFGIEPLRRDLDSKWAAVDYGSVILHILHDEARSFYQLERLWDNGKNVRRI